MKTYLVTGGAGFIGSNFVKYILNKYRNNIKIIVLDKLTYAGNLQNLYDEMDDIVFINGDICDKKLVNEIFYDYDLEIIYSNKKKFTDTIFIGVNNKVKEATYISLNFEVRNTIYKYIIKEAKS